MENSEKFWWTIGIIGYTIMDIIITKHAIYSTMEDWKGIIEITYAIMMNIIPAIIILLLIATGIEYLVNKFNNWLDSI